MGYKVLRTESAERDLDEIISYLVEKLCNPSAAVELLSAIDETYTRLEETPFLYALCQHKLLSRRGYTRCPESLFRVMRRLGMFPDPKPKKTYKPKPYEQMTHPGERVQVDVKVVPRSCIADPELRLFQYTAIDEFTRLRFLAAYPEQSTYSSADFLRKLTAWYARRGIRVECVQTDNGFEFTNRFSNSKRDLQTLFEKTAAELGIRHKLIRPYTPRHNGKVERSHREDQKRFYSCHDFYSLDDFAKQLAVHHSRSNNLPMRPLRWLSPVAFTVQYV